MSKLQVQGNASGTGIVTLAAPNTNSNITLTLPAAAGTVLTTATAGVPIDGPAFSAYMSTSQTVSTITFTKVQLQTEEFDTSNAFDNVTNYRFTPTVAGYYQVNGAIGVNTIATSIAIMIYKNGVRFKDGNNMNANGNASSVAALVYLNGTTDYLELYVYLTNGQDLAAVASSTYFQAFLARSAT
jgi:hypothetical protein